MKIGFSLPNIGPIGTVEAITKVAQRAEALGYSSLWTIERLLYPVKLQRPYPGTPDGHRRPWREIPANQATLGVYRYKLGRG